MQQKKDSEKEKSNHLIGSAGKGCGGFLKMAFEDLNEDFKLPAEFKKIKKLGAGAYGKVMQVLHLPS